MVNNHKRIGKIAFSPSPALTGTFPEQKWPSQQFRNYSQTYLTSKKQLVDCRKKFLISKQTLVHRRSQGFSGWPWVPSNF